MDNTKIQWQIQFRTARDRAWRNRAGLIETRARAREVATELRVQYGFGNVKPVKYVKGQKP